MDHLIADPSCDDPLGIVQPVPALGSRPTRCACPHWSATGYPFDTVYVTDTGSSTEDVQCAPRTCKGPFPVGHCPRHLREYRLPTACPFCLSSREVSDVNDPLSRASSIGSRARWSMVAPSNCRGLFEDAQ
jgi:hypothetical protein